MELINALGIFGAGFAFGVLMFVIWSWSGLYKQYEQYSRYDGQIEALNIENQALKARLAACSTRRPPIEKGDGNDISV